ncbi:hypothetical protein ZIOFF_015195 [Zingiber officinale]|uniref:DNA/RNA-binding protein Alba-like domain-containing protein n=1 Tax=Zingiber officinale TaxID=94328 RepID=A0A8J5LW45_ZINOF|nr:hypothetical protein ZIOFF_015195 [Zingiber officinale]
MDRYQKVEKPRPESAAISENEIRITSQGLIRNYVNYASSLLQVSSSSSSPLLFVCVEFGCAFGFLFSSSDAFVRHILLCHFLTSESMGLAVSERNLKVIVLKAMGMAISKAVAATEIIKKWNPHLHQDVSISSVSITDVWEPIEEGLVPLETKRLVSVISITLSIIEPKKKTPGRGSVRGRGWARGGYGGYNNDQGGYYGYRNNQGGYNGGGYNSGGYNGFSYNQGGYGGYRSNQGIKMVDGTQTGAEVVGQVEVGILVVQVQSMEEDLEVDQVVVEGVAMAMAMAAAEVMFVGEDG